MGIYADEMTLRDYILDKDIASFLVRNVLSPKKSGAHFMVSGRPRTILEIRQMVEQVLNKRLYLQYEINRKNTSNITFRKELVPLDLFPSDMLTNFYQLRNNFRYS